MKKEKQVFKIWSKKHERYISGDKSKTTWRSIRWVAAKLKDLCDRGSSIHDFDVRVFELQLVETLNAETVYVSKQNRDKQIRLANELIQKIQNEIKNHPELHGMPFSLIKKLYKSSSFNTPIERWLFERFKKLEIEESNLSDIFKNL